MTLIRRSYLRIAETKSLNMKRYVISYGLWGALTSIALGLINWFTIARMLGPVVSQTLGYLSMIVALLCIPLGIRYYRDKINDGEVSFGKGFRIGLGITAVASTVIAIYGMLFFWIAGEDFNNWSREGLTEAELITLEAQISQTPSFVYTPWFQGVMLGLTVVLLGLIINLVSALLLKRTSTNL